DPRANRIHADALGRPVEGEGPRELHRRPLRRDVDGRISLCYEARLRRDDGEAALALGESYVRRLREIHKRLHVDREEAVEPFRGGLVDELGQRDAGVADRGVEPAEATDG